MYEILITACLLANPASCETFELPMLSYASVRECTYRAQLDAVRWAEGMPKWAIRKLTCTGVGQNA